MSVTLDRVKPDIETFQTPFELERLVDIYERAHPSRVLEVGSWRGGTLWHWLRGLSSTVVSIDDAIRDSDRWQEWADEAGSELHLLQGHSQDPSIVAAARVLGPFGFVFIDADHTYEAVKADWQNYRPMVEPGGIVAFHDIVPRPGYGVHQVWEEIRGEPGAQVVEIIETQTYDSGVWNGIGVVWL